MINHEVRTFKANFHEKRFQKFKKKLFLAVGKSGANVLSFLKLQIRNDSDSNS